jgi:hypothetical protein
MEVFSVKKSKYDNSANTQRARIISYFENISPRLTVTEAREMGIMSLSARIAELRKHRYLIITHWIEERDKNGVRHRNGVYVYMGRKIK